MRASTFRALRVFGVLIAASVRTALVFLTVTLGLVIGVLIGGVVVGWNADPDEIRARYERWRAAFSDE